MIESIPLQPGESVLLSGFWRSFSWQPWDWTLARGGNFAGVDLGGGRLTPCLADDRGRVICTFSQGVPQ